MIKEVKNSINRSVQEILEVSVALERGNSKITNESVINKYNNFPFNIGKDNEIELNQEIKEYISNNYHKGIREGQSIMISLFSIFSEYKDQRNHILSVEIEDEQVKNFYLNTIFLEENLSISSLFINQLKNTHDISEVLNDLILLFFNKADSYYKQRFEGEDYRNYAINKKIQMLRDLTSTIYGDILNIDSQYYLFFSDDINVKASLFKYYNNTENKNHINKLTYDIFAASLYNDKKELKNSLITFNDSTIKSNSQKFALKELNKQINVVIGAGGSGKTKLASSIATKYLYLHALGQLNDINVNLLYTTYSKYSLSQFLLYSQDFKNLIFDRTKEVVEQRINDFNFSYDVSKLNSIKEKIENSNIIDRSYFEQLKKSYTNEIQFIELYKSVLDKNIYNKIVNYLKYINKNKIEYSIIDKIMFAFNMKEKDSLNIPGVLCKELNKNGVNVPESISADDIDQVFIAIKKKYIANQLKLDQKFEDFNKTISNNNNKTLLMNEINIDLDDLIYFTRYYPIYQNNNIKSELIETLQKLLDEEINMNKVNLNIIGKLFPITAGLVTDTVDINFNFAQTIVDESVLVPGYFLPAITSKSEQIILLGDINQLSLEQNFHPNIKTIIHKIYMNDKGLKLSIDESFSSKSFFDHIIPFIDKKNFIVLTDNFRCNKKIYGVSKLLSNDNYDPYFRIYIEKHQQELDKEYTIDTITQHYVEENDVFKYRSNSFDTPFLFADSNDENRYENIFSLLAENRINQNDVLIVVPFKRNIKKLRKIIDKNIVIDVIENVQGVEKKVIIFDWGANGLNQEEFKYLDLKKFNLILTRAKNMFITIGNEDFLFNQQIENFDINGYKIINSFLRSKKFNIYKIK